MQILTQESLKPPAMCSLFNTKAMISDPYLFCIMANPHSQSFTMCFNHAQASRGLCSVMRLRTLLNFCIPSTFSYA